VRQRLEEARTRRACRRARCTPKVGPPAAGRARMRRVRDSAPARHTAPQRCNSAGRPARFVPSPAPANPQTALQPLVRCSARALQRGEGGSAQTSRGAPARRARGAVGRPRRSATSGTAGARSTSLAFVRELRSRSSPPCHLLPRPAAQATRTGQSSTVLLSKSPRRSWGLSCTALSRGHVCIRPMP
jgi:hypothetical protein